MPDTASVLEYKCPCCGAPLVFDQGQQKMKCNHCDNLFEIDSVKAFNETENSESASSFQWEDKQDGQWYETEKQTLHSFICPSCGGEIITDANTAATFCPFCDNAAILPERISGGLRPDAVLPFKTTREDAKQSFIRLCKGKPLLPKEFKTQQRIDKITGFYLPFWLYECSSDQHCKYRATRVTTWSDSEYNYTKTDYFLANRGACADFKGIPMDGSSKTDDSIMESIEPFDYSQMVDFDAAYLSGFFADKYDVEAKNGEGRIRERVGSTLDAMMAPTLVGYSSAIPLNRSQNVQHGKAKYVLLPVWMLYSRYKGKSYLFAMNGQTGKMTGSFPICPRRSLAWFSGICAAVTAIVAAIEFLVF